MAEAITGIWVRRLSHSNFRDIERHPSAGPRGGGGALYIEAPSRDVPALLELLGKDPDDPPDGPFEIATRVAGAPEVSAPLVWSTKSGDRMRLFQNRQSGVRHPAWTAERGFPEAPDDIRTIEEAARLIPDGLRVYVARTEGDNYDAGFLVGPYPADWPDDEVLRALFTGAGGVRFLTQGLYLEPGDPDRPFHTEADVLEPEETPDTTTSPFASPAHARAVDRIAMILAREHVAARFPNAIVTSMPHNNPGYDIRVTEDGRVSRYVEVKGTTAPEPRFFLSENERQFSVDNADLYTLVVFSSIDLDAETAEVTTSRDGAIDRAEAALREVLWKGRLE
jgi:hypothetical protein